MAGNEKCVRCAYNLTWFGLWDSLFLAVFKDRISRLGVATTAGKVYLAQNATPGKYLDLLDTYLLLGDPALRIPLVSTR